MGGPHRRSGGERSPRPRHGRREGARGPSGFRARVPPPVATGQEARYLRSKQEQRAAMAFQLVDGETVRGVILGVDGDTIRVRVAGGPELVLRKADIQYLYEE